MRSLMVIVRCLVALVAATSPMEAQATFTQPAIGTRLRLRLAAGPVLDGYLVRIGNDSVMLDGTRTVPLAAVSSVDVRARERRGRIRWASTGIALGAAVGAVWCSVERNDCMANSTDRSTFGEGLRAAAYGGALVGAVGGFIYGTQSVQRWRPFPLSALRSGAR